MPELTIRNPAGFNEDTWGLPEITPIGITCGNHFRGTKVVIKHENVPAVRACYAIGAELAEQQAAEIWAENAWLRHAEGWYR